MLSRLAINPLPWILDATAGFHLDRTSLTAAFAAVSGIGFTAVQADVPLGFSVSEYLEFLSGYELRPAPSYFGADFEDTAGLPDILERARVHARVQLELGNDMTFVAGNICPERRLRPAVGADFDESRLKALIAGLTATSQVFTDYGLTPGLHPHVGSWIETEREVREVLDSIAPEILGFGPDTGHLAWGGMTPQDVIRDYANRVVGVHIKDVDQNAARIAREQFADYTVATETLHVWTEPGRGSVDFESVFDSIPKSFDGWFMLEVDVPNHGNASESSRVSAQWIESTQKFEGSLR